MAFPRAVTLIEKEVRTTGTVLCVTEENGDFRKYWPNLTQDVDYLVPSMPQL